MTSKSEIETSSIPVNSEKIEYNELEKEIIHQVFNKKRNIYLSGPGGCGKSYLSVNVIKKYANETKTNIALTSTTGVSALSIGATTIHRWSGIKLGKEAFIVIVTNIRKNKECFKRWCDTKILIIDEVSMLGLKTFELLDKVGRNIRENDSPFGGLTLVLSGDFLQLPPVQDDFVFESELWDEMNIKYFRLKEPKRYPDINHFNMLQRIRLGKQTQDDIKALKKRCDSYIDYIGSGSERKEEIKPTRIFSLKKDVEKHNLDELAKLTGDPIGYNSIDKFAVKKGKKGENEKKDVLSPKEVLDYTEYLDTVIPRRLSFKAGAQVMLTYNLSVEIGLVNGSRGVIKSCEQDGINVLFKNGITTKIAYNMWEFDDGKVKMIRYQLPLMLAWAISVHKCQGASLDYAILDLGSSIFSPGMSYVSLSRVRTLSGIYLSSFVPQKLYANEKALDFEETMEALESVDEENNKNVDVEIIIEEESGSDEER